MSNLKLEKQLCFKLYSLNKSLTKLYAPILKELELTYPQYLVMLVLWENNKACSIKEIGKALDLDTGTLSPLLKRMEKHELINRTRSDADERTVYISLTSKGDKLKRKAQPIPEQMFALTGLSHEQMLSLQETLAKLIETTKHHV
ncbi:MarR family winged helix-turn-helix transcriptional regulator [Thalassotalea atypica]|uniref:MarR family winged helix-turn-helix transcriptional regulator n=1 Tax=Thalassotalea atypica TaxID=2054316 RepID=UPI002572D459|nr:MarR family transcriptional regulator [Thalassotalea atypica]